MGDVPHLPTSTVTLTDRERDVLRLLANGLADSEIAQELFLTVGTVKWYNRQIYSKLSVSNRTEAVIQAQSIGLVDGLSLERPPPPLPAYRHNLPAQLTPFIGRKQELADIAGLLNVVRLLTITGPGGIGKTRLALEFARSQLGAFPDGVYMVSLASVTSADNLIWAIAETVGFQFRRSGEPLQQLLDYFHQKTVLLILDNFEHLLDSAALIPQILKATQQVRMIVTSRERVNLYGEVTYAVGGLTLPESGSANESARSEAVDLFIQRATATLPSLHLSADDLDHIGHICQLVEGMPLGIELAATWVDTLALSEIADEIEHSLDILEAERRDALYTHNSIRAAFNRSWNLLDAAQQAAFRRLAVFRGGFERHAARAISEVNIQTLRALVSKSLLRHDPASGRYSLHELLRYFAQEKLEESGEAEVICDAHATCFASFLDERWQQMKGRHQHTAFLQMEADVENIRTAWEFRIHEGNIAELRKFLHGLWVIYDVRGWHPAGLQLFQQAIAVMQTAQSGEAQAGLGWLLAVQGMFTAASERASRKAYELAREGVDILRRLGQPQNMVIPLISLFITARQVGETEVSVQAAHDCLEIAAEMNDQWGMVKAKQLLALRAIEEADYEVAERLGNEALAICQSRGDRWSESVICIEVMGTIAILRQRYTLAEQWLFHGLQAAEAIEFKYAIQMAYFQLGYVAVLQEDFATSARYWHQALDVSDHVIGGFASVGFFGTASTGDYDL